VGTPGPPDLLTRRPRLGWFGLVAPAGTPKAIIDKVHRDVVTALSSADVKKRFDELGMAPVGNTPAEFTKAMKEESARWANVVSARKLQID